MVLVYGDTNPTLAVLVAGLRSFNRSMPEEVNRVLTDNIASLLFCPTKVSVNPLKKEGITDGVFITCDIMVDALYHALPLLVMKDIGVCQPDIIILQLYIGHLTLITTKICPQLLKHFQN